mmetsp:Transcript_114575/g.286369  ORF Transcript_114575/g.286369 Transcript_114575/m.286369 type:complete len:156 (+) Transcript_114575:1825-2292(+)
MLRRGFFAGVLRSKGFMWSASDHNVVVEWSQAGLAMNLKPGPKWLKASLPLSEWPEAAAQYKEKQYGDRRQELVFIGASMKEAEIRATLDRVLLTTKEFSLGPKTWSRWMKLVTEEVDSEKTDKRQKSGLKRKKPEDEVPQHSNHEGHGADCQHT